MRTLLLALPLLLEGCGTASPAQQLEDACESQRCASDPPKYVNCMPVISPEWEPVCSTSCRTFLQQTCNIQFAD